MSAQKLKEFITHVKNGGVAKSSHYIVQMTLPTSIAKQEPFASNYDKIILFCEKCEIPGINVDTVPVRTYGERREVPFDKVYDPLQLSFYVDNDFIVKRLFDSWINEIVDPVTRHINFAKHYTSDSIKIYVQDTEDNNRYAVTLHGVYPKTIAPIQLSYDSKDVMRMNVTMVYKYATYESFQRPNPRAKGLIERANEGFRNVFENGIGGAISGITSNFNYGFESIPTDYFTSFSSFQENISLNSLGFDGLFDTGLTDLTGTEFFK